MGSIVAKKLTAKVHFTSLMCALMLTADTRSFRAIRYCRNNFWNAGVCWSQASSNPVYLRALR